MNVIDKLINYKGKELSRYKSSSLLIEDFKGYRFDGYDMKNIVEFIAKGASLRRIESFFETLKLSRFSEDGRKIILLSAMFSGNTTIFNHFMNNDCLGNGDFDNPLLFIMTKTNIQSDKISFKNNLFLLLKSLPDNYKSIFLKELSHYRFKTADFIAIKENFPEFMDYEKVKDKFLSMIIFKKIVIDESVKKYVESDNIDIEDFKKFLNEKFSDLTRNASILPCISLKSPIFFKEIKEFEKIIEKHSDYICSGYPENVSLALITQSFLDNMDENGQLKLISLLAKKINENIKKQTGLISNSSYMFSSPNEIDKVIKNFLLNKKYIKENDINEDLSKKHVSREEFFKINSFYLKLISKIEKDIINISLMDYDKETTYKEKKRL